MRLDGVPKAIAWSAFASVCVAPFLFGSVERSIWIPLCQLWLGAGFAAMVFGPGGSNAPTGRSVSRALLPLHALFLVQLIPLPAAVLRAISPGSFAAHFLPDPGDGRFRPLSVSPSATVEAWLYLAGMQGLFLALLGIPTRQRRLLAGVLLGVTVCLVGEGLWQSRTSHPAWLYGRIPIEAPTGLETAGFGPYFNRNHFATAMALGAAWACGLAISRVKERGGLVRVQVNPSAMAEIVVLGGASLLLILGAAASGSRSGLGAAVAAIAILLARSVGPRRLILPFGLGLVVLLMSGSAAMDRLMSVDVVVSRWAPWVDMTNLWRFFPVFGSGVGTFGEAYWPYQMNAAYEFWQHAHNEYLEWSIETGLLGIVAAAISLRSLRRCVSFAEWGREAAIGALAAVSLQALLDFPFHIPANAALLVSCLALCASPDREAEGC